MSRLALKDFTFSDGTFIPKGTLISAAAGPIHGDNEIYPNAAVFDPFRFSKMRDEEGEGVKHHLVTTQPDYVPFGHGRHAWCVFYSLAFLKTKFLLCLGSAALVDSLQPTSSKRCWRTLS
jgi:cytochrome P450